MRSSVLVQSTVTYQTGRSLTSRAVYINVNCRSVWLMTIQFCQILNSYLETKKTKEKMHELSRQVEIESHKREIVADTLHGQEGVYKLSLCAD